MLITCPTFLILTVPTNLKKLQKLNEGIITKIGQCFAQQTKKVLVTENEVLTEGDGQADPRKLIEGFIIYPNPTDGKFTTDVTLSERGNISIKIFNFVNNALMASEKDRGASSYTIPFDIWLFRSDGATCFGQTVPL